MYHTTVRLVPRDTGASAVASELRVSAKSDLTAFGGQTISSRAMLATVPGDASGLVEIWTEP